MIIKITIYNFVRQNVYLFVYQKSAYNLQTSKVTSCNEQPLGWLRFATSLKIPRKGRKERTLTAVHPLFQQALQEALISFPRDLKLPVKDVSPFVCINFSTNVTFEVLTAVLLQLSRLLRCYAISNGKLQTFRKIIVPGSSSYF
jgi:hypothetical protein